MTLTITNHWYRDLDPGPLCLAFALDQPQLIFDQAQALGNINLASGNLKKAFIKLQDDDAFELISTPAGLLLATVQDRLSLWKGNTVWTHELRGNDAATICASDSHYAWAAGTTSITIGDLASGDVLAEHTHHCLVDTITYMNEHALWFRDEENVINILVLKPFADSDMQHGDIIEVDELPEDATELAQYDDRYLVMALEEQEWMIWDMAIDDQQYIAWEEQVITCVAHCYHQDLATHVVATGTESGLIRLWTHDGEILAEIEDHDEQHEIDALAFSTDGRYLASAAGQRELHVIELGTA